MFCAKTLLPFVFLSPRKNAWGWWVLNVRSRRCLFPSWENGQWQILYCSHGLLGELCAALFCENPPESWCLFIDKQCSLSLDWCEGKMPEERAGVRALLCLKIECKCFQTSLSLVWSHLSWVRTRLSLFWKYRMMNKQSAGENNCFFCSCILKIFECLFSFFFFFKKAFSWRYWWFLYQERTWQICCPYKQTKLLCLETEVFWIMWKGQIFSMHSCILS